MLFNSLPFVLFFLVVAACYWALRGRVRAQNVLLVLASYYFYGYWDYRFCFLLAATTTIQYLLGHAIHRAVVGPLRRKGLMVTAVAFSLGMLGVFKYLGFFASSLNDLLSAVGAPANLAVVHLVLPVGMSFYTFKEISYVVDIYRGRSEPTSDPIAFALYVAFFPQLIAGPIERSHEMLPQIANARSVTAGDIDIALNLIIWGLFKKAVVADNLAKIVDPTFEHCRNQAGFDLLLGVLAYTFQIYCDFSGYSDIARGVARLMGFRLPLNFKLPYFAADPSEFWQRWHVTLSSWLRDYLYIPLGGNRGTSRATAVNLLLTMSLGGLWHGASWNFVLWGAFHGVLLVLYRGTPLRRISSAKGLGRVPAVVLMFTLVAIGWVLFRSESLEQAVFILTHVSAEMSAVSARHLMLLLGFVGPVLALEVCQERTGDLLLLLRLRFVPRVLLYTGLIVALALFAVRERAEFIYFQF